MRVLIVAAHGSRNKASAAEVAALVRTMAQKAEGFDRVLHAFLQFSDPLLDQVLDQEGERGAKEVVVFPYFIAQGSHVTLDIPRIVAEAASAHPGTRFAVTPHLGALPGVVDLILTGAFAHLDRS